MALLTVERVGSSSSISLRIVRKLNLEGRVTDWSNEDAPASRRRREYPARWGRVHRNGPIQYVPIPATFSLGLYSRGFFVGLPIRLCAKTAPIDEVRPHERNSVQALGRSEVRDAVNDISERDGSDDVANRWPHKQNLRRRLRQARDVTRARSILRPSQQLRQLGDVHGDAPGFIAR